MGSDRPYFAEEDVEQARRNLYDYLDGLGDLWRDKSRVLQMDKNPGYGHRLKGSPKSPLDCIHYLKDHAPDPEDIIKDWNSDPVQQYIKTVMNRDFVLKCLKFDKNGEVYLDIIGVIKTLEDIEIFQKRYSPEGEDFFRQYRE